MEILIICILILINGFFALSEIAIVSSKKSRLEKLRKDGYRGAKTAIKLYSNSENFLSAIQVGITLIGIVTGVYGGVNIADDLTPFLMKFAFLDGSAEEAALVITVLSITYFSIVIGELVPKTIAMSRPELIATRVAPAIYFFSLLFYPFVRLLSFSTSLINRVIGIKKQTESITESELRHLLKAASGEGIIEKAQNLIHDRVFYFSDKKARHIMTHRIEVEWIDLDQPLNLIMNRVIESKHSRLVCSKRNLDEFNGILSVRDYLSAYSTGDSFDVYSLLKDPIIVPESMEAHRVLELFKQKKKHFCVVVNEFGSLEGIITPHDILENLIGEIPEEGEKTEPDIFVREDKSILVSGDAPAEILDGIFDNYTTDLENVDYSTVAGFVIEKINKFPQIGDKFTFNDYVIEIVDIDGNRVDKILISKKQESR